MWISHKPPISYPSYPYIGNIIYEERPRYVIGKFIIKYLIFLTLFYKGRSMTESNEVPDSWINNMVSKVDEIWVCNTIFLYLLCY